MRSGSHGFGLRAFVAKVAPFCSLLACRPGAIQADRSATAKDPLGPRWEQGAAYGFDLHTTAFVHLGQFQTAIHYELRGRLTVAVVEQQGDRTTLHLRLTAPQIKGLSPGGIAEPERLSRELQESDAAAVQAGGKLVAFGFRQGASSLVVSTLRQLAAGLQVADMDDAGDLLAEEHDTTGRYLAAYTFDQATRTLLKTKVRYLAPLGTSHGPGLLPRVIGSTGRIRVLPNRRLESLDLQDALAMEGAGISVHAETSMELRLRVVEQVGVAKPPVSFLAGFTVVPASEPAGPPTSVPGLDQAKTGGASFREIVSRLRSEGEARDAGLFLALAAALRTEANAPAQAVRMIVGGSRLASTLVDGLGAAACPACESALIELLRAPSADIEARTLHALARFANPGDLAVAAMKARLDQQAFDPTALYALGAYARLFAERDKPEKAAELGRFLVERLEEASGPMQKIVALRALENAGWPEALSLLPRFSNDQDESVRDAARLAAAAITNADGRSR